MRFVLGQKELRTPKFLIACLVWEERLHTKICARARVKYRTTVISIVVSVGVFIAMVTFIHSLVFEASSIYYKRCSISNPINCYFPRGNFEEATQITQMEGVKQYEILRQGEMLVKVSRHSFYYTIFAIYTRNCKNKTVLFPLWWLLLRIQSMKRIVRN